MEGHGHGAHGGQGAHGGHGGHIPPGASTRALVISGWLTGIYFVVELAIGLWTRSVAVTSDAFHTFSAVGGVLLALAAARFGRRLASPAKTFGWLRAEIVGALFNGLFLVAMAIVVLWMGAMRLRHPIHLPTGPMLWAAGGGLVTELIALRLLFGGQKGDLNVRGAFWHIVQTFVGSFIIVVSALVIRFTGWTPIDPLLGMAFGVVLFWASWRIIRDALHILLQGTPADLDLHAMVEAMRNVAGVVDVHHVHAWSLTSGRNIVSAHVCVAALEESPRVQRELHRLLKDRFGIYFETLQLETDCPAFGDEPPEIDVLRRDPANT